MGMVRRSFVVIADYFRVALTDRFPAPYSGPHENEIHEPLLPRRHALGQCVCSRLRVRRSQELARAERGSEAQDKAKAAEVPAWQDPECIRQKDARLRGEIGQEGMTERCSRAFGWSIPAPGGSGG